MASAHRDSSRSQGRRPSVAIPALLAVALLASGVAMVVWSSSSPSIGSLEHEEVSEFSRIRIRRDGDVRAMTFVRDNGQEAVQSRVNINEPGTLLSPYAHGMFASYLYQPEPRRVLIVGLGGGAMVRFLTHHQPQLRIDAVEIDPVVVRLADQYFGVRSGGNVTVHTADAVKFIEQTTDRFDLILMDAFLRPSGDTDAVGVPTRMKTLEFLGRLKEALNPGGAIAFNVNEYETMTDDIASVATAFGTAIVYRCPPSQNKVVIAIPGVVAPEHELRARAGALDTRFGGALQFGNILANRE